LEKTQDSLGERIRQKRESIEMSQGELAASVGISQKSLSQIETGKTMPRRATLAAIAGALGVDVDSLFWVKPQGPKLLRTGTAPTLEELKDMAEHPEQFDTLYLANIVAAQFAKAPVKMRLLALRALFDRPELLFPYRAELADAPAKPSHKKRLK
jgi:transcriptional regulator with XRE-family HTH domain